MKPNNKLVLTAILTAVLLLPVFSASAGLVEVELLSESFEEGDWLWTNWDSTLWYRSSNQNDGNGTYCAAARYDTPTAYDGQITTVSLDASDAESVNVVFYFSTVALESGDLNLYYWDGADYVLQDDLTTYGAIFPTWVKYTDTISDSAYLTSDFRMRLEATIGTAGENAWLDGVRITKTIQGDSVLSLYPVGEGTIDVNPVGPYSDDTLVTFTATPTTGWTFEGWSGALSGDTSPTTLMVDADKTVVAYFTSTAIIDVSLSATSVDRGSTITSTLSGGTPDGELMIQYERASQMLWADQVTLDGAGAYSYPLKIPDSWIDGTYTIKVKDGASGTVDTGSFVIPVPSSGGGSSGGGSSGGGAGTALPHPAVISLMDPKSASKLLDDFSAKDVSKVLKDVTPPSHVAAILVHFDADFTADVIGKLPQESVLELLSLMEEDKVLELIGEMDDSHVGIISILLEEDKEGTALRIEAIVKSKIAGVNETERVRVLEKLGAALGALDPVDLVELLIYIAELPETPSTVAYLFDSMATSDILNVVSDWLSPGFEDSHIALADVFSFLSDISLDEIYRGMANIDRETLYVYLYEPTLQRLPEIGSFEISGLEIVPEDIHIGDDIVISAILTNIGTETDDYVITLQINDLVEETFTGLLSPGNSMVLDYVTSKNIAGTFDVNFNGQAASFDVIEEEEPVVIPDPAELVVTSVEAVPDEVVDGDIVSVFVTIENRGEETGTENYELYVDSSLIDDKDTTISGGGSDTLIYVVETNGEGLFIVEVDGVSAQYTVTKAPSNTPWGTYLIIAVVLAAIVLYVIETRTGAISSMLKQ